MLYEITIIQMENVSYSSFTMPIIFVTGEHEVEMLRPSQKWREIMSRGLLLFYGFVFYVLVFFSK